MRTPKGRAPELRASVGMGNLVPSLVHQRIVEPSWFCGSMRTGQTFRISSKEYVQPVLRTFMLLLVAGECPTTKNL